MKIVHLVQSVEPYGAPSPEARTAHTLPVAQAEVGHEVTLVAIAPAHDVDAVQPNQRLARRLSPLEVPGTPALTVEVLEGQLVGSHVRLFLLVFPETAAQPAAFARAAVALLQSLPRRPEIVHLHQVTGVDADTVREALGGPAVVQSVYDARGSDPSLVHAIQDADSVVVPCSGLAATDADPPPEVARALATLATVRVLPPGLDAGQYNPAHDPALEARYAADRLQGRVRCREALQRRAELPPRSEVPILGVWTRGGPDGGTAGLVEVMKELEPLDLQVVALPSDAPEDAAFLAALRERAATAVLPDASNGSLRGMLAGADALLIPDLLAPLGERALIALRYGLVPIARRVHAHRDILVEYDARSNSGGAFLFDTEAEIFQAVHRMTRAYADSGAWGSMVRANLLVESTWERCLAHLDQIYRKALAK